MFPSIDPSDVGASGLFWLLLSYGFAMYVASKLISEGSDLLLLVPSLAGLVGGVVLPIIGAIPDGAIMLFSGLGDIEDAQETLSVGVGALAGSTIMLLTVSWSLSVFSGRVDIRRESNVLTYFTKPKLINNLSFSSLYLTGVSITKEVRQGSVIMMATTLPYFLIQIPASFLHGEAAQKVGEDEKYWALAGLLVCLAGFITYLYYQLMLSSEGEDKLQRTEVIKHLIMKGEVSMSGALVDVVRTFDDGRQVTKIIDEDYRRMHSGAVQAEDGPTNQMKAYLTDILKDFFHKYDQDGDGSLTEKEFSFFLRDFHESLNDNEVTILFRSYDKDGNDSICFDEFIDACYKIIKSATNPDKDLRSLDMAEQLQQSLVQQSGFIDRQVNFEEEEDVPADILSLSPEEQQKVIKRRAFSMLVVGTAIVLIFADPMVDVLQEIAVRTNISSFYVSFILAPLASNMSEVVASQYYAAKKTTKTITVALTALEGAAAMNNTFCLSIFMGLIYFRGIAWQYTSETIAIVLSQLIVGFLTRTYVMTTGRALIIFSIFPLSLILVELLESMGFD